MHLASNSKKILVLMYVLLLTGCDNKEEKTATPIAIEDKVFDITIQSASPKAYNYLDESAQVGINSAGNEARVLIEIPNILKLYREDVVLSSIANIEIHIKASSVQVNPENIQLYLVKDSWTPFASWSSRFTLSRNHDWATAGGDVLDIEPITPSVEKVSEVGSDKNLVFNLTKVLIQAVSDQTLIHGFLLRVIESDDNASQTLPIFTSNSSSANAPKAYLTLNNDEVIVP